MRFLCDHDELSFRRPFRFCRLQFSNPCRPAGGDPRASSPTRGFPKERTASFALPALRPAFVVLALAMVARWRRSLYIVRPDTVIAWHRRAFAWYWTRKSRRRPGRPNVAAEIRNLIRNMSQANPLWGAPRIHGELLKLGIEVAQSTVAKYLRRRGSHRVRTRFSAMTGSYDSKWAGSMGGRRLRQLEFIDRLFALAN